MMESFSATCDNVKYGSPLQSCDQTNTIAVQGAVASRIKPAMSAQAIGVPRLHVAIAARPLQLNHKGFLWCRNAPIGSHNAGGCQKAGPFRGWLVLQAMPNGPRGTLYATVNCAIMPESSCSRMWQCAM
jgi:hypothetical protein